MQDTPASFVIGEVSPAAEPISSNSPANQFASRVLDARQVTGDSDGYNSLSSRVPYEEELLMVATSSRDGISR